MHSACNDPLRAGFPHSDILGSLLASNSPRLFAGSRVLHRLSTPRHPPCALGRLITPTGRRPIAVYKPTRRDTLHGASRRRFNRLKTLSFASVAVAALSGPLLLKLMQKDPALFARIDQARPSDDRDDQSISGCQRAGAGPYTSRIPRGLDQLNVVRAPPHLVRRWRGKFSDAETTVKRALGTPLRTCEEPPREEALPLPSRLIRRRGARRSACCAPARGRPRVAAETTPAACPRRGSARPAWSRGRPGWQRKTCGRLRRTGPAGV